MPNLVLEVGTEEMPAGAVEAALEELRGRVDKGLRDARLGAESVDVWGTPRRLIVRAAGVPSRQPDQEREARGPARNVAFDAEGKPTGAAIGFARKQGVPVESLAVVQTPQGEYVAARVTDVGKPATEVLGGILAESALGLYFPKKMLWGRGTVRFVRPVRWVLCLLDSEVVPLEIAGVASGRTSSGHRFLAPQEFEVPEADSLLGLLRKACVEPDAAKRREAIRSRADALAREAGGVVPWDEGLLDENTWLVEWPTALLGAFDSKYLELPRPVLVTAMKKHQRFFPVEDAQGRLLARFIAIRNGGDRGLELVREGDERVLTARFADASYFYEQDRRTPLETMAEKLERLLFQEKLGTMADKRARLELLAASLSDSLGSGPGERKAAIRAAFLCKADLVSQMVIELPALQGVMGREYALAAGEDPAVADAIAEHYRPRSATDALSESSLGKLLAIADRLDTLVGYVGIGILPSGSSDPYGLRRAAQGVVQILAREPDMPPLVLMEAAAAQAYKQVNGLEFDLDDLCNNLWGVFEQRLSAFLEERGVRYDLIDAALSGGSLYNTLVYGVVRRAETLQSLAGGPNFVPTVQAAARVANILRTADTGGPTTFLPGKEGIHGASARSVERAVAMLESESRKIDHAALKEPSERRLFEAASRQLPEIARRAADYDYEGLYRALDPLREPVNTFFDDVMVMVEDAAVRRNRIALLCFVDALYNTLADFTKVVIA